MRQNALDNLGFERLQEVLRSTERFAGAESVAVRILRRAVSRAEARQRVGRRSTAGAGNDASTERLPAA